MTRLVALLVEGSSDPNPLLRYRIADALVRLPVPNDLQDDVLKTVKATVPSAHFTILRALAVLEWNLVGRGPDRALMRALRSNEPPYLGSRTVFRDVDSAFVQVPRPVRGASAPGRPMVWRGLSPKLCRAAPLVGGRPRGPADQERPQADGGTCLEEDLGSDARLDEKLTARLASTDGFPATT